MTAPVTYTQDEMLATARQLQQGCVCGYVHRALYYPCEAVVMLRQAATAEAQAARLTEESRSMSLEQENTELRAALATLRSEIDRVLHIADYDDHGRIGELEDMQRWRERDRVALATLRGKVKEFRRTLNTFATATATGDYQQGWKAMAAHLTILMNALGLPDTEAK